MNDPFGLGQILKTSKITLIKRDLVNKSNNVKSAQGENSNAKAAGEEKLTKLRAPKAGTTRKIKESLLASNVNKKKDTRDGKISEPVESKTVEKDLINKFSNLKLAEEEDSNAKLSGEEELVKLRAPKPETTRKIKETLLTSNVNKKEDAGNEKNSELVKSKTVAKLRTKKISDSKNGNGANEKKSVKHATNIGNRKVTKALKKKTSVQLKAIALDSNPALRINDGVEDTITPMRNNQASSVAPSEATVSSMTYIEHLLVSILHTKVSAHPNGFFANNLPNWYEKTFDKTLPTNWLDLLKKSPKFSVEETNNKFVIYAKGEEETNEADDITKKAASEAYKYFKKYYLNNSV